MTHDPFQTYPAWGAYSGANPFGNPYMQLQNPAAAYNPLAAINPLAATQGINPTMGIQQFGQQGHGIPGYGGIAGYGGLHPQLQLAAALASQWQGQSPWQNPLVTAIQHNPLALAGLQNPLLQNPLLQNPLLNPILSQLGQGSQFGQGQYSPFQQFGQQQSPFQQYGQLGQQPYSPFQQFGQQLQPQTWLGQGAIHPLAAYFAGRGFQAPGITPWA